MSKTNKITLETGRGRKRGHGEGKRGPPKDDKSYKIDINQYIVGGEGMEGEEGERKESVILGEE